MVVSCCASSLSDKSSPPPINEVIQSNVVPRLVGFMRSFNTQLQFEATWALTTIVSCTIVTPQQVRYVIDQNVIPSLCEVLTSYDANIIMVALEALEHILRIGKEDSSSNVYACMVRDCRGYDKLEQLQYHSNKNVYEHAVCILKQYFVQKNE
eukprot:PhF_6_TR430/c0_g1_i1/m.152